MTTFASHTWNSLRFALLLTCALVAWSTVVGTASAVEASPPAFVPGWDGVTDATSLTWNVASAGRVRVLVVGVDGRARRVLVDEVQQPGTHSTWWDGRNAAGQVLPSGRWLIRVEQSAPAAATSARGRAVAAKAAHGEAVVTLQEPPVAIREVKLVRGSIGSSTANATARARVDVSASATLAAAVVDGSGRVVRSLRSGQVKAGTTAVTWDGRGSNGRTVPDGAYTLLVAASGAGRPTNTIRTPVRVDRTAPVLTARRAVRGTSSRTNVTVPMVVRTSEPATVAVRLGAKRISWKQPAGVKRVTLRGDLLGIRPAKRARTVRVLVLAADDTGNARAAKVTVVVPAVAAPKPAPIKQPVVHRPSTTPTPAPTPPAPASGKLRWPVVNIVTSEFGMRWGRPHQGLDINADTGTAVYAAAAGTVLSAGTMDGYGIQVTLQHANGLTTRYAHFSATALGLVAGDGVSSGQLLGLSGCTGSCTGPHLHFETRVNGIAKNPRLFLG